MNARERQPPVAIDIPPVVRERAMANARAGQQWLATLPDVVATLADQWDLTVGETYQGGTAAYVAQATRARGQHCVLKVAMPLDMHEVDSFQRSITAHQLAAGHGCATLLEHDTSHAALLLEALGSNLDELNFSVGTILQTVAETLTDFWRPVPAECGLPNGAEAAAWLANFIVETWEALEQPCSKTVIDRAVSYCDERSNAFDPDSAVLVHGDAHGWNTLDAGDGRFKFVDPEGLISSRAHDLAVPMREYNEPLIAGDTARLVRQRAADLSSWCDVDPEAVWQWGFIERVSTGLANVRDFTDGSRELFLKVAERCL